MGNVVSDAVKVPKLSRSNQNICVFRRVVCPYIYACSAARLLGSIGFVDEKKFPDSKRLFPHAGRANQLNTRFGKALSKAFQPEQPRATRTLYNLAPTP